MRSGGSGARAASTSRSKTASGHRARTSTRRSRALRVAGCPATLELRPALVPRRSATRRETMRHAEYTNPQVGRRMRVPAGHGSVGHLAKVGVAGSNPVRSTKPARRRPSEPEGVLVGSTSDLPSGARVLIMKRVVLVAAGIGDRVDRWRRMGRVLGTVAHLRDRTRPQVRQRRELRHA